MAKDVIIALDFPSKAHVMSFLDKFTEEKPFVKIGMELFYAEGPAIVREIKELCFETGVKLDDAHTKSQLGALCGIEVDCAVCVVA